LCSRICACRLPDTIKSAGVTGPRKVGYYT
jgi:hypothetical protein